MGEDYRLACYEYLHIDTRQRTGQIKNHFSNEVVKMLQGGSYTDTLRFTDKEINNQFNT